MRRLRTPRSQLLIAATAVAIAAPLTVFSGGSALPALGASNSDNASLMPGNKLMHQPAENEGPGFQAARNAYFSDRVYNGAKPLSVEQAARLHDKGANQALALGQKKNHGGGGGPSGPAWSSIGPTDTEQVARTTGQLEDVSGRISALAVDPSGDIYAGAAGGGLWKYSHSKKTWTPLTDSLPTLAVGAVAIDPTNPHTIYLGTGEADLSGDSHFGDGIWKSTDGGLTWSHLGCDANGNNCAFDTASISRLIVQHVGKQNALYVATIRGRGGERRVSPPTGQNWGIFRSTDDGSSWTMLKGTDQAANGATDLEVDPNNPSVLYATFWGDGIYKTTNAAQTNWAPIMNGLPTGDFAGDGTRFSIAVASLNANTTRLYAGFDWVDGSGHHPSQLFRSDNGGSSWQSLPTTGEDGPIDSVSNYCDIQCDYDNVVEVDPSNPNIVYAGGEYNYGLASGGVYRSVNGGVTWQSLGFDLHPDFHALAFQPGNPQHIVIGNDGGVWQSPDRGGRPFAGGDLSQVDWQDLNVGLTITQFDSIDYGTPDFPNRYWGGTQDNGTQRKSSASTTWFDIPGGDGGQVLVDHSDTTNHYAFGSYYGISPYRIEDGGLFFGDISGITQGINTSDRSEFYAPWVMNQGNGNQLFYGTFRVYRTDNAETPNAGDVVWKPISDDLTTGCAGTAPNGDRNCTITALGHAEGGNALWAGTQEGRIWVSTNAGISDHPTWNRVDTNTPDGTQLANRPITSFAVDRSNWRIAYVSYAGYDEADLGGHGGHIFKTTDGGQSWTDVTGDLPDGPVNTLILDPSNPNHLIAGTDFGAFTADLSNGAPSWSAVAGGLPAVQVWQLAYDSSRARLVAGTHGRGAWIYDLGTTAPALVASTADTGKPVGPGTDLTYTITVKNEGNADATNVTITQPVPAHTTFVSASDNGSATSGPVTWTGLSVPKGGSKTVTYTVKIDSDLPSTVTEIDSDGIAVSDVSGAATTGSPFATPIAPAHAVTLSTPTPKDGTTAGSTVTYPVSVTNPSYNDDSYTFTATSTKSWTMTVFQSDCTTPIGSGGLAVGSGDTGTICVQVAIPAGSSESDPDSETVTATSVGDSTVTRNLDLTSIPVTTTALLVDEDGNAPDVQSYYTAALTTANVSHAVWDLAADKALGSQYVAAHRDVYWFTGGSYPGPLLPYENLLKGYLDGGGHLFVSGEDLLDQAAGTTSFVHDYLHINWDGTEAQNDKSTATVTGVPGSPVGGTLGTVPLNHVAGLCVCEDEITPIAPATAQFNDDGVAAGTPTPDGLAVTDTSGANTYKVVFLAFPFEEYGSASNRAALATAVDSYFSGS